MNESKINQILFELYALDPSLRGEEKMLIAILEKMLRARPAVKVDEVFAQNLKRALMSHLFQKKQNFIFYFSSMIKKPVFLAGAATLGAVLLVSAYVLNAPTSKYAFQTSGPTLSVAGELPRNAFGPLTNSAAGAMPLGSPEAISADYSGARQGGGAVSPMAVSEEAAVTANNPVSSLGMMDKMIAPYYNYTYKYTGEPLNLTETEAAVFRRIKDTGLSRDFAQAIVGKNNGMIDLSKLDNAVLQNFQLSQNTTDGYLINVDLQNGNININPNYEKWYPPCFRANCDAPKPLTEKDIPSNDRIIGIANEFLDEFGISRDQYGTPVVEESWKNNYPIPFAEGMVRDTSVISQYIPDVISVIYPIAIEGQKITESNGMDFGLHVNVDIRKMKGQGVWNLFTNQYQKSNYETETEASRILKIAENGGSGWYQMPTENTRTLNLGTPEKIYISHYQYVPETGLSNELYIPALKFPVTNIPTDQPYFYQRFIVVPLVKEILTQYEPQPGQPPVTIMPLIKEITSPSAREMEVKN
jgi:hypothetical protein